MDLKRRARKGSFTVEAAFLYPVIVLLIAFMLYLSMDWYQNVERAAEDTQQLREMDTREDFLDSIARIVDKGIQKNMD